MKTLLPLLAAALLAATLMACPVDNTPLPTGDGGATLSDAGFTGSATLAGGPLAFTPTTALELHNLDQQGGQLTGFSFVITDHGLSCGELEALHGAPVPKAYKQVYGGVLRQTAGSGPAAGTYQVGGATSADQFVAFVYYNEHFPDGGATPFQQAPSGSVTLDTSTEAMLKGSFQVVLPDALGAQSPLQGTFEAPYCP